MSSTSNVTVSRSERGMALVLGLFLLTVLSVLAASLMFLSQTETYASQNYRSMSQARYGAESGVHKAVNYLLNTYTSPGGANVNDPLANYNTAVSPVTYNGNAVVLSALDGVTPNYPYGPTQTAFAAAAKGTITMGDIPVQYGASATLLSMRQVMEYGSGAPTTVQTWLITADGSISGAGTAVVEVSSTLERQVVRTATYAAFATGGGCGALTFGGGGVTDSYTSSNMTLVNGAPVTQNTGGDVGSNGNLTANGNATINGTLSTPRTGVGNCSNGSPDAATLSKNATLTGGLVQLPQTITYSPPNTPAPVGGNVAINGGSCAAVGIPAGNCTASGSSMTLTASTPLSLGNVTVSGVTLHLTAGTYNFDSLKLSSTNSSLVIDSGPVILNITDLNSSAPLDLTGGGVSNSSFIAYNLQIQYGGSKEVKLAGGATNAAMLYAPNAPLKMTGGSNFYGSLLALTIDDTGGTAFHYDRHLQTTFDSVGNHMLSSFTWKKY